MNEYRKCNICGKKNDVNVIICDCGNNMLSVPIVQNDEITEEYSDMSERFVCKFCGEEIDEFDIICPFCDADISEENLSENIYYFMSNDGNDHIIPSGTSIFGRDNLMREYLQGKHYVSDSHFTINYYNDEIKLTDHSLNGTFVNGVKLSKNEEKVLHVNDNIGMGGVSEQCDKYGYYVTLMKK